MKPSGTECWLAAAATCLFLLIQTYTPIARAKSTPTDTPTPMPIFAPLLRPSDFVAPVSVPVGATASVGVVVVCEADVMAASWTDVESSAKSVA